MQRGQMFVRTPRPPSELTARFSKHSVATLQAAADGDYLVSVGLSVVGLHSDPASRVAGPAVTAHNAAGDNLGMHAATSLTESGDVLVITSDDGDSAALWGELMTEFAKARDLKAVVVDGAIRDLAGVRSLGFPVWYRSVNPRTAAKARVVSVNAPVALSEGTVHPGDIVVADQDGIMAIPVATAESVLSRAAAIDQEEEELLEKLRTGRTYFAIGNLNQALEAAGTEVVDGSWDRTSTTDQMGDT